MLKKYKDVKVGEYFENDGYVYVKCENLKENGKYEYPAVDIESGAEFLFIEDAECSVVDWK